MSKWATTSHLWATLAIEAYSDLAMLSACHDIWASLIVRRTGGRY